MSRSLKLIFCFILFVFCCIIIDNVYALDSFSAFPTNLKPDSLGNYSLAQFTNYDYLFWVNGNGVSNYAQKWSYQYDTTGRATTNKSYSVSTIAYINPTQVDSSSNASGVGSPVVLLNGQSCSVKTQTIRAMWEEYVNNNVQGTGLDWQPYDLDGLFYSVVCENIIISGNTSYLDFFFPNSNRMRHFNVSYLQFTETSGNSVEQALQENNQALGTINNQLQDNWAKQEEIKQEQQATNNKLDDLNSNITSDDTTESQSAADDLKNNPAFNDTSGLSSIISLPMNFINSIGTSCSPLQLNLPFFQTNLTLPCMSTIYSKFGALYTLVFGVINGFVIYRILVELFYIVKNSKDPDVDKVEVMDL